MSLACPLARLLHGDASFLQAKMGRNMKKPRNARDGRFLTPRSTHNLFDLFLFTCLYLLLVPTGRDLVLRLLSLHLKKRDGRFH